MAVKRYKPTSPARRFQEVADFSDLAKKAPEKSLVVPSKSSGGRNNSGVITMRRRGGGQKRRYRIVDFKRPPGDHEGFKTQDIEDIEPTGQ